jgi:hypothetical protein
VLQVSPEIRRKVVLVVIATYALLNVALYWLDPFSSPWHYHDHHPEPMAVSEPADRLLALSEIVQHLDDIDIAYGAMAPRGVEQTKRNIYRVISVAFLPATIALHVNEFMGYLGPATPDQQAFTRSVKARYNHLANLAVARGYRADRHLFEVEPSLSKKNGASFGSLLKDSSETRHP